MEPDLKNTLKLLQNQWKNRADHYYEEARKSDGISEHNFHNNIAFGRLSDRAAKEFDLCLKKCEELNDKT